MRLCATAYPLVPLLLLLSASANIFLTRLAIAQTLPLPPNCPPVIPADTPAATAATPQTRVEAKSWENVQLIHTLPVQSAFINKLFVFSPDGQTLATGSYEVEMSADGRTPTAKTINTILAPPACRRPPSRVRKVWSV
ncbi:MAG: hypothetical protein KME08_12215 [Aphanothece sp. CMT-3BRIN-NPC111]|jgi:hypothetical protein|nr:hypothetical protein [Aphanothece sp. CMT-3BRIN-NPC111]